MLCMLALLSGCYAYSTRTTPIDREALRVPRPFPQQEQPRYEGSLFIGENGRSLLFVDRKARQINDIITIRIVESATASGEATTETERESSVSGSLEALFGFEKTLQNNGLNPEAVVSTSLSSGFDGSGTTARRNSLRATITAVVREVFANGNLYIEGTKEVVINNERQYIILSGVVRPEDIQTDNSITSDLIADARVVYSGAGALADKQRPGLLGRLLDVVWPF
jgi:flagellar L-ring protein precursor FlgH